MVLHRLPLGASSRSYRYSSIWDWQEEQVCMAFTTQFRGTDLQVKTLRSFWRALRIWVLTVPTGRL